MMRDETRNEPESDKSLFDQLPLDQVRTVILVILFGGGILMGIWSTFFEGGLSVGSLLANLSAGLMGSGFTFIAIDLVLGRREKQEEEAKEEKIRIEVEATARKAQIANAKARLREASTPLSREVIFREMRELDLLKEINLGGFNLAGMELVLPSNLYKSNLSGADLRNTSFFRSNLEKANLRGANLENAILGGTNLQGADLRYANLKNAGLKVLVTIQTMYEDEPITINQQDEIQCNEETILPDGSNWNPQIDMTKFTNPDHPEYWRSDNPDSPAYHGKPSMKKKFK